ncbi:MAG: NAD(P)/FAD-dependent oxidoreductase, partial [Ensifer adhaerens]
MLEDSPNTKIDAALAKLGKALERGDVEAAVNLFQADCYWRDLVTFTWNLRTMEGHDQIRDMLTRQLKTIKPSRFRQDEKELASDGDGITQGWFEFETDVARGYGHIRLKNGLIWTLLTTMSELKGHEEPKGLKRPMGAEHGHDPNRKTWSEKRQAEAAGLGYETQPYVVIIGGGQGGIALGARLRQLGVPTIIIEKNERPGDSWRKRYKSLCLHDPVWYDHLPYIPFPENWPVFAPKDKIGDWLEMYTKVMELNYWNSTTCKSASYDEDKQEWTVVVERDGKEVVLKPKQLVLATGMSGKANVPKFKGQEIFRGEQQHSSQHPGPDAYKGKKVVVVGANNSAHDICAALWEAGADVTMVQRSSTHIVRSDSLMEIGLGDLYSERAVAAGMTTRKADLIFASLPYRIMHEFQIPLYDKMRERDAKFYADLERAGFMLDWGADGSGLFMKYLRRGSGYYIDVGACDLIIDGSIKLKSGSDVDHLTETSVVLKDGAELPADLVVYATGYGSMNGWAADLISR